MQSLRLWTTALVTRIDGMVSRIENHEAIAQSALHDVRRAAARAKVQLRRVRADGAQTRSRLEEARNAEANWRERAARKAGSDEAQALECLRRAREAGRRTQVLTQRLAEHDRIESELAGDVRRIDDRVRTLEEHRHVLSARESRADALAGVEASAAGTGVIDDLFDRWEIQVSEREYGISRDGDEDAFEHAFTQEEEESSLREELAELTGTTTPDPQGDAR